MAKTNVPDVKELLKAGVQFGHETRRWNPKMAQYIFGAKNNIHVIDITQTAQLLAQAVESLEKISGEGSVIFVGTKRQASDIVKQYAMDCGSYFVSDRWVGGFFTNFDQVRKSLKRLRSLEDMFENGVEGRTKYEVSRMKSEWQRLSRLYQGVKTMDNLPKAVIVIDPRYEAATVKEAKQMGIPVFALVDTNCNPEYVNYVIPGNDDAIRSIEIIVQTLAEAISRGSKTKSVVHEIKDYSKIDVKIIRKDDSTTIAADPLKVDVAQVETETVEVKKPEKASNDGLEGGILGKSRSAKK